MTKKKVLKNDNQILLTAEEIKIKKEKDTKDRYKHISKPSYKFEIGEKVLFGNHDNVVVLESKEDNKFYWLEYDRKNKRDDGVVREKAFVAWMQVRKYTGKIDYELAKRNPLNLSFAKEKLSSQLHRIYNWGVDFDVEYQREYVWDMQDKVDLIDSILKNYDIGKFVYVFKGYDCDDEEYYEILDGKQRLSTIRDFYEDRFSYHGKYFSDLSRLDQNMILDRAIDVAEVEDVTLEQKLEYFVRLNTKGKVMDKEHIAKIEGDLNNLKKKKS